MRTRGASIADLEALYRARYDRFAGVAAAIVRDADEGRDIVQTAFATAVRGRAKYRGDGELEAWLWRIVVNEARRIAAATRTVALDEMGATPSKADEPPANLEVREWIATLPDRQRTVVFLRYYADLDYRTIAQVLEIETGTVSATLSQAHNRLRQLLREAPR